MNEKIEEKVTVITVEDPNKIKFAKVHKPERTKTIQTIETTASRRPSVSAPKRPKKTKETKNIDIVKFLHSKVNKKKLITVIYNRLNTYYYQKNALKSFIRRSTQKRLQILKVLLPKKLLVSWLKLVLMSCPLPKRDILF